MVSFLDELNSTLSKKVSSGVELEFKTYVNNVLFPYWLEREYDRNVKQEIINKVKRGEYQIHNGKKIVCGEIRYINCEGEYSKIHSPEFEVNDELVKKLLDMGLEYKSYGEELNSAVIIYPKHNGFFTFFVKSSPLYTTKNIKFNSTSILKKTEKRKFTQIERVGLLKKPKEVVYEREVDTYELCNELKTICKAFAERGKKDSIEIMFELKGYLDQSPIAKICDFDKKIITNFNSNYSDENHIDDSCLTYRVEF